MIRSVGIDRALMPFALLGRYIAMLIAPLRLNPDYGGETIGSHVSFGGPYLYFGVIAVIAMIIACAIALRRRAWIFVFCIICFALIYGMIGNILTLIGTNFGERLMYLPSAFFCIAAAVLLAQLPRRRAMIGTVTAVVVLFSLRTISYAARWNDPPRLFSVAIDQHPHAIRLYLLLSEEYQRRGDLDRAADVLARGREIEPDYYRVWLNSARLAIAMQQPERALAFAREAQHLTPTVEGQSLITTAAQALTATTRPASSEEDFFR
jgi:tetratricopeptide (TPR) repeat protein